MKNVFLGTVASLAIITGASAQDTGTGMNGAAPQGPANAQYPRIVGHIGIGGGYNHASEFDDDAGEDEENAFFGELDGSVRIPLNDRHSVAFDLRGRYDDFEHTEDFDSAEDPQWEGQFGGHILKQIGQGSHAGFFGAYGLQLPQDNDTSDGFDVVMGGVEGQAQILPDFLLFGQVAVGSAVSGGHDTDKVEGFVSGVILRGGVTHFATRNTAIVLDVESATTGAWADEDEGGTFLSASLSGETRLPTGAPLFVRYGARYAQFVNVGNDDEKSISETEVFVNLAWVFGAETPQDRWTRGHAYGTPRLPIRGAAWTQWSD